MNFSDYHNFALSISGGGAKGAYAVGVIKYLWEKGVRYFRSIFGTSTGALISAKVALACATQDQKHIDELEHIFRTVQKPNIAEPTRKFCYWLMGQRGAFAMQMMSKKKSSIYDNAPLQNLIDQYISAEDWNSLIAVAHAKENPIELGFQVTNLQDAKSIAITNLTHPDKDQLKKAMVASTSIPVLFPLTEFEGKQIADGGIINVMPIESIFASNFYNEFDGVISIALDPPFTTPRADHFSGSSTTLVRVLDIFLANTMHFDYMIGHLINAFNFIKDELSVKSWKKLEALLPDKVKEHLQFDKIRKPIPVFEIYPEAFLGYGLEFKQPTMSDWVDLGYNDAKKKFNLDNEDLSELPASTAFNAEKGLIEKVIEELLDPQVSKKKNV